MIEFTSWLAGTPFSQTLQQTLWAIPWIQTLHIVALSLVFASAFMIDLRVLDVACRKQSAVETVRRFSPWVWVGLIVLLISGALLIIAEPVRSLMNVAFWIKMALLAAAIILTLTLQARIPRTAEGGSVALGSLKSLAVVSILVWGGIIIAGRWIAYAY